MLKTFPSLAILLILLFAYSPVLLSKQTVDPDAAIILKNITDAGSFSGYLSQLVNFKTLDFQPVRDLFLSIDLWIFNTFEINTFIFQNVFWWFASVLILGQILILLFPQTSFTARCLALATFATYPLFSGVVSWGMNRKHILAFFFILAATFWFLKNVRRLRLRDIALICALYSLSVLSQPINILWPVWVIFYSLQNQIRNWKLICPLILILGILGALNFYYYNFSPFYLFFYPEKTSDLFNIPDKILALGHYTFQIVFPFLLSFKYDLSHWSILPGIAVLVAGATLLLKKVRKTNAHLLLFCLLPVLVVLNDPHVLSDAYLIVPAAGLLLIIVSIIHDVDWNPRYFGIVPLIAASFTYSESISWTSRLKLAEKSFQRRPSCASAINYAKVGYDFYQKKHEALKFMEENECLRKMEVTPFFYRSMNILFSHHYFHDDELPLEQKLSRLKELATKHPKAHLALIGLMLKSNLEDEARSQARKLADLWGNHELGNNFDEITFRYVHPFCARENIVGCLRITSQLILKPKTPYL